MGKRDCYPHLVEMSTHLTALHSVEGGHIQREVRTCLSLPSRVVSVEAWWGEKFYFNQAVVTRHHFPSTPIPVPPHVNKDWVGSLDFYLLCHLSLWLGGINIHGEDPNTSLARLWWGIISANKVKNLSLGHVFFLSLINISCLSPTDRRTHVVSLSAPPQLGPFNLHTGQNHQHWNMYITICEKDHRSKFDAWNRALKASALGQPWGMG